MPFQRAQRSLCHLLAVSAGAGWLARATSESTGRSISLLPIGLPMLGLATIASVMYFMSRVLLAVSETASWVIALLVWGLSAAKQAGDALTADDDRVFTAGFAEDLGFETENWDLPERAENIDWERFIDRGCSSARPRNRSWCWFDISSETLTATAAGGCR